MTVTWLIASGIMLHHRSVAYELFLYCSSLIYFSVATVTTTTKTQKQLSLLLPPLPLLSYYLLLNTLLQILSYPGVVELTTQLLILENILWLPLCRIDKFGLNSLPSKTIAIPYTCGLSRLFSGAVAGEHSSILWVTWDIYLLIIIRTWEIQKPRSIPQLRGEVRNFHLALH